MSQGNAVFTGLDLSQEREVTVGTETLSIGVQGPVSERVRIAGISTIPTTTTGGGSSTVAQSVITITISVVLSFFDYCII